jgi:hypothetical protein
MLLLLFFFFLRRALRLLLKPLHVQDTVKLFFKVVTASLFANGAVVGLVVDIGTSFSIHHALI